MISKKFKYDVAFSFLEKDEDLANSINCLIKGRLSTFIYSNNQNEIAGTDGERIFNQVFGTESRLVVILYRPEWGTTSWTRIEQTAIRNRAFDQGYDFVIFVHIDKNDRPPQWLPKNRIWVGLERWGIEGAASVIESRVQEAGGEPKEESIAEKAQRIGREIEVEQERKKFLGSAEGVAAAHQEVEDLFLTFETVLSQISSTTSNIKFTFRKDERTCTIYAGSYALRVIWSIQWANSLDHSVLYVQVLQSTDWGWEEPKLISEKKYYFDLDTTGKNCWRPKEKNLNLSSTEQLVVYYIELLIEKFKDKEFVKN